MNIFSRPYFRKTVKQLEEEIEDSIRDAEETLSKHREALAKIKALKTITKNCPFCDGEMIDVSPLFAIETTNPLDGNREMNFMKWINTTYGTQIPKRWECQKCLAFDIDQPNLKTLTKKPVGKKGFALVLRNHFVNIQHTEYFSDGYELGWFVKMDNDWYFLVGSAKCIKKALGIQ